MNNKKRHQQARKFQIKTEDLDSIDLNYNSILELKKKKKKKNINNKSYCKIKYENKNFASKVYFV